jgi:hypothetical protein
MTIDKKEASVIKLQRRKGMVDLKLGSVDFPL